jgi:lipopolysaccharide export system protein LptA
MLVLLRMLTVVLASAGPLLAQGAQVAIGGLKQDTTLPVEVTADSLEVNQAEGTALFTGNVEVAQGGLRLSAETIRVEYATGADGTGDVRELRAQGGVTLVNGTEAAEADEATYSVDSGTVIMTGNVLLTQGQSALAGERLVIDLNAGTGRMEGRVRTVFRAASP